MSTTSRRLLQLHTREQIGEALPYIDVLLRSFRDAPKAEERFFASCRPYVLRSSYVCCPEESGAPIGIGYIFNKFGIPNLGVAVGPRHQGQGVGSAIMASLLDYTRTHRRFLTSCVWKGNAPSINLHTKQGFRLIRAGTQVDWYAWAEGWKLRLWLLSQLLLPYDYMKYWRPLHR